MTMVSSGPISIGGSAKTGALNQSINTEIFRSASTNTNLNEFTVRSLAQVPSGTISLSQCYGKSIIGSSVSTSKARDLWRGAAFGNSTYVIAGQSISSSSDGINWTKRVSLPSLARSAVWSGSMFVVVGLGGFIFSSPDGTTWTQRTSGVTNNINSVTWSGSMFVAVGGSSTSVVLLSSTDGITWTQRSVTLAATHWLTCVAWGANKFVACTTNSSDSIRTSTDGITWTSPATAVTLTNANAIVFGNNIFMAVGNSRMLRYSSDGLTWTTAGITGSVTTTNFFSVVWTGTKFIAGAYTSATNQSGFWSSTTGAATWVGQSYLPTSSFWLLIDCWLISPTRLMGFGGGQRNSPAAVLSTDSGATLTNILTQNTMGLAAVTASSTRFVAGGIPTGGSSTNAMIYSDDGINWASSTYSSQVLCLTFGAGRFITGGLAGRIAISTDGITWTTVTSGITQNIGGLAYNGSLYVCVASGGFISTSPDGTTWTARTSNTTSALLDITWSGSIFVATGTLGLILTSPDGITWTQRTSGVPNNLSSVTWGNGNFVAASILTSGISYLITSPDGITWTTRLTSAVAFQKVFWTGGIFVTTGLASSDITQWNPIDLNIIGTTPTSIAIKGTTLVYVNTYGSIATSTLPATAIL